MSTPAIPQEDSALDALFQSTVASITGLNGSLVRPRWQPIPPVQPEPATDWCAIGVMVSSPDAGPYITPVPLPDPGTVSLIRHEQIELLASFFGPNAKKFAGVLRDGLSVPQFMEPLAGAFIGLVGCGPLRALPYMANEQWVHRIDMSLTFRRKVTRVYPIPVIATADIHLFDDTFVDDTIEVPPNSP